MTAAVALRAAIHQRLAADATLAGVLGGPKIYDELPADKVAPYIILAAIDSRDAGASEHEAEEHDLVLNVWSRQRGAAEALWTAGRVTHLLRQNGLTVDGYRLANLAWLATEARRTEDGQHRIANIRFRALTEPLP